VADLSSIVKAPLYLSQRGHNEALEAVFGLDGVVVKRKHQISLFRALPRNTVPRLVQCLLLFTLIF
jgi:hypothetical protein